MTASAATDPRHLQRGGFLLGLIIGLLFGLAIALGVALSVNNVQVPFAKKLPQRTADQDVAEAQRNQNWNPNAALAIGRRPDVAKPPESPASVPSNLLTAPPYVILPPPDPLAPTPGAAAPGANYFVQAGAFRKQDEADHQRARLNMLDLEARVTTVDQSGQAIYRVRVGPLDKTEAEATRTRLELEGIDASLIFVKSSSSPKN